MGSRRKTRSLETPKVTNEEHTHPSSSPDESLKARTDSGAPPDDGGEAGGGRAPGGEDQRQVTLATKMSSLGACVGVSLLAAMAALGLEKVLLLLLGIVFGWAILGVVILAVLRNNGRSRAQAAGAASASGGYDDATAITETTIRSAMCGALSMGRNRSTAVIDDEATEDDGVLWSGKVWIRTPASDTAALTMGGASADPCAGAAAGAGAGVGGVGGGSDFASTWPPKHASEAVVQIFKWGTMRMFTQSINVGAGMGTGGSVDIDLGKTRVLMSSAASTIDETGASGEDAHPWNKRRPLLVVPVVRSSDETEEARGDAEAEGAAPTRPMEMFACEGADKEALYMAACRCGGAGAVPRAEIAGVRNAYAKHQRQFWATLDVCLMTREEASGARGEVSPRNEGSTTPRKMFRSISPVRGVSGPAGHGCSSAGRSSPLPSPSRPGSYHREGASDEDALEEDEMDDTMMTIIDEDHKPETFDLPTTTDGKSSIEPWTDEYHGSSPEKQSPGLESSPNNSGVFSGLRKHSADGGGSGGGSTGAGTGAQMMVTPGRRPSDRASAAQGGAVIDPDAAPDLLRADVWDALLNDEGSAADVGGQAMQPPGDGRRGSMGEQECSPNEIELKEVDRSVHTGSPYKRTPFSSVDGGDSPARPRIPSLLSDSAGSARRRVRDDNTLGDSDEGHDEDVHVCVDGYSSAAGVDAWSRRFEYLWFNSLSSRIWFEMARNGFLPAYLRERIGIQLDKLVKPKWMGSLKCVGVTLSGPPPLVMNGRQVDAARAGGARDRADAASEASGGCGDGEATVVQLDVHYGGEIKLVLGTSIDLIAASESFRRGNVDGEGGGGMDNGGGGDGPIETGGTGSELLSKLGGNILGSKIGTFAKNIAKSVSDVSLELELTCRSVDGRIFLSLPAPPSNSVWWCFETAPAIDATAKPLIGGLALGKQNGAIATRLSKWIIQRLKREVRDTCVYPKFESFSIPHVDDIFKVVNGVPGDARSPSDGNPVSNDAAWAAARRLRPDEHERTGSAREGHAGRCDSADRPSQSTNLTRDEKHPRSFSDSKAVGGSTRSSPPGRGGGGYGGGGGGGGKKIAMSSAAGEAQKVEAPRSAVPPDAAAAALERGAPTRRSLESEFRDSKGIAGERADETASSRAEAQDRDGLLRSESDGGGTSTNISTDGDGHPEADSGRVAGSPGIQTSTAPSPGETNDDLPVAEDGRLMPQSRSTILSQLQSRVKNQSTAFAQVFGDRKKKTGGMFRAGAMAFASRRSSQASSSSADHKPQTPP